MPRTRDCTISLKLITAAGWQNSLHENIKSLREEIGLVRILIEKHMKCRTGRLGSPCRLWSFNNMILTLEKTIKECHA